MKKNNFNILSAAIIISALVGLLGGWGFYFINNRYYNNNLIDTNLSARYGNQSPVIFSNARNVTVEHDEKAVETIQALQKVLIGVFLKNQSGKYNLKDYRAQALIVTTDGWLISNLNPVADGAKLDDYVVIDSQGRLYDVGDSFADDNGFLFLRLKDARDLPVIDFVGYKSLTPGMQIVEVNWHGPYWQTFISQVNAGRYKPRSSDSPIRWIETQSDSSDGALAAANLSGKIAGLFNAEGRLMSMDYFEIAIQDLLSGQTIGYAKLGVSYTNLAWQGGWADQNGALLNAVAPASAAAEAGLSVGDIIISLNHTEVNKQNDLLDILAGLEPGDEVSLTYLRQDKKNEVTVVLQ